MDAEAFQVALDNFRTRVTDEPTLVYEFFEGTDPARVIEMYGIMDASVLTNDQLLSVAELLRDVARCAPVDTHQLLEGPTPAGVAGDALARDALVAQTIHQQEQAGFGFFDMDQQMATRLQQEEIRERELAIEAVKEANRLESERWQSEADVADSAGSTTGARLLPKVATTTDPAQVPALQRSEHATPLPDAKIPPPSYPPPAAPAGKSPGASRSPPTAAPRDDPTQHSSITRLLQASGAALGIGPCTYGATAHGVPALVRTENALFLEYLPSSRRQLALQAMGGTLTVFSDFATKHSLGSVLSVFQSYDSRQTGLITWEAVTHAMETQLHEPSPNYLLSLLPSFPGGTNKFVDYRVLARNMTTSLPPDSSWCCAVTELAHGLCDKDTFGKWVAGTLWERDADLAYFLGVRPVGLETLSSPPGPWIEHTWHGTGLTPIGEDGLRNAGYRKRLLSSNSLYSLVFRRYKRHLASCVSALRFNLVRGTMRHSRLLQWRQAHLLLDFVFMAFRTFTCSAPRWKGASPTWSPREQRNPGWQKYLAPQGTEWWYYDGPLGAWWHDVDLVDDAFQWGGPVRYYPPPIPQSPPADIPDAFLALLSPPDALPDDVHAPAQPVLSLRELEWHSLVHGLFETFNLFERLTAQGARPVRSIFQAVGTDGGGPLPPTLTPIDDWD